ncbi:MAG: Biotin synthesis protein BioH [Deltaproteobacteria bacterium]|nr:Biotin synthesis protein BioH [Deltaproteobacteria bacterium]
MRREELSVDGGTPPSMVLLPGWATDGRLFDGLFPGVSTVRVSGALRPGGFPDRLAAFLDAAAPGPVTVVGWSLGGFLAAEFAARHPGRVRRLVLVGVRRRYPAVDVEAVRERLSHDRKGCLSDFYTQCFFPSRMAEYRRFRAGLQREYLREMDDAALLEGLSCLASSTLSAAALPPCPVAFVHGEKDVVAPAAEAEALARESGRATYRLLRGAPHAAFLDEGFGVAASDG